MAIETIKIKPERIKQTLFGTEFFTNRSLFSSWVRVSPTTEVLIEDIIIKTRETPIYKNFDFADALAYAMKHTNPKE